MQLTSLSTQAATHLASSRNWRSSENHHQRHCSQPKSMRLRRAQYLFELSTGGPRLLRCLDHTLDLHSKRLPRDLLLLKPCNNTRHGYFLPTAFLSFSFRIPRLASTGDTDDTHALPPQRWKRGLCIFLYVFRQSYDQLGVYGVCFLVFLGFGELGLRLDR